MRGVWLLVDYITHYDDYHFCVYPMIKPTYDREEFHMGLIIIIDRVQFIFQEQ